MTTMRSWLETNLEWLATGIFIALVTSTIIGLKEGSRGAALRRDHHRILQSIGARHA